MREKDKWYRERVREGNGKRERESEGEIHTIWGSINEPSLRGRVWFTLKL